MLAATRSGGIPVSRLLEGEKEKLLRLDDILHERVIGQDEAVEAVSAAVRRSRAGLQDANRPIGSFIFLGPTGVGKTTFLNILSSCIPVHERVVTIEDSAELSLQGLSNLWIGCLIPMVHGN